PSGPDLWRAGPIIAGRVTIGLSPDSQSSSSLFALPGFQLAAGIRYAMTDRDPDGSGSAIAAGGTVAIESVINNAAIVASGRLEFLNSAPGPSLIPSIYLYGFAAGGPVLPTGSGNSSGGIVGRAGLGAGWNLFAAFNEREAGSETNRACLSAGNSCNGCGN